MNKTEFKGSDSEKDVQNKKVANLAILATNGMI